MYYHFYMSKSRRFCFCVLVFIPFNVSSYILFIPINGFNKGGRTYLSF
mgnify:FL=1